MFKIELHGLKALQAEVDDLIKDRIPKMTAIAIYETTSNLYGFLQIKLKEVFENPTRWTMQGLLMYPTKKDGGWKVLIPNPSAYVWFKDDLATGTGTPAAKYLWPEVHGGPRNIKRFEKALQRFGVLPLGSYTVPGKGLKLNRDGNIPTGTITEILTGVGALTGMSDTEFYGKLGGYKRRKKTTANYFVVKEKHGGLVPGIWERLPETGTRIRGYKGAASRQKGQKEGKFYSVIQGRRVRPVLIFVKGAPKYRQRLPFYDWAQEYINTELPKIFNRIAAESLAYQKGKKG